MPQRTGDGGALGVAGELDIVGRPETAVGHLHDPGLGIGGGSARLLRLLGLRFVCLGLGCLGLRRLGFALQLRLRRTFGFPGRLLGGALSFLPRLFLLEGVQFVGHCQRRADPLLAILRHP